MEPLNHSSSLHPLHHSRLDHIPEEDMGSSASSSSWPSTSWMAFVTICVLGIIFNCSVFLKRKYMRRRSSSMRLSLWLLCVMAGADTACLVALLFILSIRYLGIDSPLVLTLVCKVNVFTIHAASAFSLYCWLVLSLVRYVAVFSPYTHLRIDREPRFAVIALAIATGVLESWLLHDIEYVPQIRGCETTREGPSQKNLQIAEIIGSYFIPLIIITACDFKVLFFRDSSWGHPQNRQQWTRCESLDKRESDGGAASPDRTSIDSAETAVDNNHTAAFVPTKVRESLTSMPPRSLYEVEGAAIHRTRLRKRAQQMRALRRALLISVFDLMMNLPNYVFRLYLTITDYDVSAMSPEIQTFIENGSQIMYFTQFALNAFYLVCLIYDSPNKDRKKKELTVQSSMATSVRSSCRNTNNCHGTVDARATLMPS